MTTAWGSTGWGYGSWGAGGEDLRLVDVQPVRENVVRLLFNERPKYTRLLNPNDASSPDRYVVTPVAGTLRGQDPRQVTPVFAELAAVAGAKGKAIDVTVDRPFDPYPSQYIIAVNQLVTESGGLLLATATSKQFDGLYRYIGPARRDLKLPVRDIANPQLRSAVVGALPMSSDPLVLGTIPVDDQGDYAFDDGLTSYRKRVLRRVLSLKGRFAHLTGYGLGVGNQLKRSAKPSVLSTIASEAEKQIRQEPETEQVKAELVRDTDRPDLFWLRLRIKTKTIDDEIDLNVPFSPVG